MIAFARSDKSDSLGSVDRKGMMRDSEHLAALQLVLLHQRLSVWKMFPPFVEEFGEHK